MPGAFSGSLIGPFHCVCIQYVCIRVCFKSHLEQIVDSKPDQSLLEDKIDVHNLVSEQLNSGTAKISSCSH